MTRPPRTDFASYVAKARPANRKLQLLHTCDGFAVRSLIEDNKLSPFPRESFDGERVLFLYYGRPAYRLSSSTEPTSYNFFLPVCLILSPDAVNSPRRVFPFDTGALEDGLFSGSLHPGMIRDDFQLDPDSSSPQRLVTAFYGSNENYFRGEMVRNIEYDSMEFEVESFVSILRGESGIKADDRRSAIEIHTDKDIILANRTLEAVILPSVFLDNVRVREFFVGTCRADPLPYEVFHFRVTEYTSEIYRLAREYIGLDPKK